MANFLTQRTFCVLYIAARMTAVSHAIDTDALPYLDARAQEAMVLVLTPSGEGSGFIVGYHAASQTATILSAQHVIAGDGGNVKVVFFDGRQSPARVIRESASKDLCVLAARRERPPVLLELDASLVPLEPLQPVVVVGRDDQGVKQHVGAYLEDPGVFDIDVDAQRITTSAFGLPGFSGGAMVARPDGGQVAVVGLVTHGSPEISTGPDAAELGAFLADAGVRVGLSNPGAGSGADDAPIEDALDDPADWYHDDGEFADSGGDSDPIDIDADDLLDSRLDARDLLDEALADAGWPLAPRRPPSGDRRRRPVSAADGQRRARVHREVIIVPGSGVRIVMESIIQ